MTSRDFCYWLQGYFELQSNQDRASDMGRAQVELIRAHLAMVFKHEIDPSLGTPEHVADLKQLHDRVEEIARRPSDDWRNTPITC